MNKKVSLIEFEGNSNIGNYLFVNDKFCLIGRSIPERFYPEIEKVLDVPVYSLNILNTGLVGIFLAGNNDFLLVPEILDSEFDIIKEICKKHSVKVIQIKNRLNTFGNNILFTETEVFVNSKYSSNFVDSLSSETGLSIKKINFKDFEAISSVVIFLNNRLFISQYLEEEDITCFKKELVGGFGSVNKGSAYLSSGIVGNKNGILIGSITSTIEIQNILESLDYV